MSLDLFQTDNRDAVNNAERGSAPLLPAGFKESFDTAWDNAVLFGQSFAVVNARHRAMDSLFQQAYDATKDDRFRRDSVQFENRFRAPSAGAKDLRQVYNDIVGEHLVEQPEREVSGLPPTGLRPISPEELDVHAADISKDAREAYKAMAARQGGGFGAFAGTAAGSVIDPINVLTFPLAAPEALGIIKTGLTWAGIGGGTQTAIEAIGSPFREKVEPGYAQSGEPGANILEAGAFAGTLGATIKALGTGWRWYANKADVPRTVRDAGNVLDSETQVAETNPLRGPEGETAHRAALSKTLDDVVKGDVPNVDGIITPEMMDGYQSRLTPIMKARQAAIEASNQAALLAREDARLPGTMERLSEMQLGEIRGAVDALDTGLTERVGALAEGVTKAQAAVEKQAAVVEQLKTAAAAAVDDVKLSARFDKAQAKLDKLTETHVKRAGELPLRQVTAEARAADRKGRATAEMTKAVARLAEDGYGLKLEPAEIATLADNILKAPADSVEAVLRDTTEHLVDKARAQRAVAPPTPFGEARPHEEQAAHALRITNIMRMRVQTLAREVGYAMPKEEAGAIAARLLEVKEPDALAILDELVLRPRTIAKTMAEPPPTVPPGIPTPGETITAAAVRMEGKVYTGAIHSDAYEAAIGRKLTADDGYLVPNLGDDSGFVTNTGRYVTREEAKAIALAADQVHPGRVAISGDRLLAEDLRVDLKPVEAPNAPAPSWLQQNRQEAVDFANRLGVTDQIRQMANEGKTAAEISKALGEKMSVDEVRAVRDSLGIAPAGPQAGIGLGVMPAYERAAAEQHIPANVEKLRTDPEMTQTVERDLQRMRAETPDKEIPVGVDKDGAPITKTVEETATDIEQRKALADEVRASCGPQPEPDSGGQ